MTDDELDRLLHEARATYRVADAPLPERTWTAIERRHFDLAVRVPDDPATRAPTWRGFALGIAAALLVGVGLGRAGERWIGGPAGVFAPLPSGAAVAVANEPAMDDAFRVAAVRHLGESVALLASFSVAGGQAEPDSLFMAQARELLTTTRLLMDTPANGDPNVAALLQDLELVLAQVARLTGGPDTTDVQLIADALATRDLVPRLLSMSGD